MQKWFTAANNRWVKGDTRSRGIRCFYGLKLLNFMASIFPLQDYEFYWFTIKAGLGLPWLQPPLNLWWSLAMQICIFCFSKPSRSFHDNSFHYSLKFKGYPFVCPDFLYSVEIYWATLILLTEYEIKAWYVVTIYGVNKISKYIEIESKQIMRSFSNNVKEWSGILLAGLPAPCFRQ